MGSFALLNTNVGLTTNVKIVVDSNYKLSLDSIESNDRLSLNRYKRFQFNKRSFYDEIIPLYYKETPIELAYFINYNNDVDVMSTDFKDQYDELYSYGAKNIINNKSYLEEYEYFAPLYIKKEKLPEGFIIFRVDGSGLGIVNKQNFKSEILENLKVVKLFDLTPKTPIGEWLDLNFKNNNFFPKTPLEVDFRQLEFTKWNGIDFNTSGYSSKSFFMDDIFEKEQEIFELEKTFFDSYKNNGLVFPNILNLTFLFDDEPSTQDIKRKWSINRYYGFYLDQIKLVKKVTPYKSPSLREDVVIQEGNILYSESNQDNPFVEKWNDEKPFYVELDGTFYLVERFTRSGGISIQKIVDENGNSSEEYADIILVRYKIISDLDLEGRESELNQNFVYIEDNKVLDINKDPFIIEDFDSADVWIIEIDGIYHSLKKDENNNIEIFTDYLIKTNDKNFEYRVGGINTKVSTVVDFRNSPKIFKIYKLNFTDIKSFDNRIIDTDFSKFEYEKLDDITETDETKMYVENPLSQNNPKSLDDFVYKEQVVNIPVASEYTANWETFKIKNKDLSDIWRVNPVYCKWGYQNSISQNDVPYLLNNSLVFEDFNRAPNVIETNPIRSERNLDYFYSINSSTSSYINHSLHIEKVDDGEIDENFSFELDKYLNLATYSIGTQSATYSIGTQSATYSFNYFKYFFERKAHFDKSNLLKNVRKYSKFNEGDNVIPNMTVFKGIEFRVYDVESVILDDNNNIENINLKTTNKFHDYDFSVLLSDNKTVNKNCDCININITAANLDSSSVDSEDSLCLYGVVLVFDDTGAETQDLVLQVTGEYNGKPYYYTPVTYQGDPHQLYVLWNNGRWEMWYDFDGVNFECSAGFCENCNPNDPFMYLENEDLSEGTWEWAGVESECNFYSVVSIDSSDLCPTPVSVPVGVVNLNLFKTNNLVNGINIFEGIFNDELYEIKYDGVDKWILYKNGIAISELIMEEFISCPVGEWQNLDCCLDAEICITTPSSECNFTMILCVDPEDDNTCIEVEFTLIEEGIWTSQNIPIIGSSSTFDAYIENIGGTWSFIYSKDNINTPVAYLDLNEGLCPIGEWVLEENEDCCIEMVICYVDRGNTVCFTVELERINDNLFEGTDDEFEILFYIERSGTGSAWNLFQDDPNFINSGDGFFTIAESFDLSECPNDMKDWTYGATFTEYWGEEATLEIRPGECVSLFESETGYTFLQTNLSENFIGNCYNIKFEKEGDDYIGSIDIEITGLELTTVTFSIVNNEEVWSLISNDEEIAFLSSNLDCPTGEWTPNGSYSNISIITTNSCDLQGNLLTSFECSNLSSNELRWLITEEWKMDKQYNEDDIVIFDDIFYIANTQSFTENPVQIIEGKSIKSAPFNLLSEWSIYTNNQPFWSPLVSYSTASNDYVYNNGEYYQYIGGTEDFWNPVTAMGPSGYGIGDVVLYKGRYYFSMTSSNNYTIDTAVRAEIGIDVSWKKPVNKFFIPWVATQSSDPSWEPIRMWNPSETYSQNTNLIVHNDILWIGTGSIDPGEEPGISSFWNREYSLEPDFNYIYQPNSNPIIYLNNRYYICNSNVTNSPLDNGIVIYINKKWKNILVNINVSDNTLPNLSNSDRDELYVDLYYKLTANNFIQSINDITNRYGYSNYLRYVIIDEENNITEHSYINNITNLKYILECGYPDQFSVKVNSLTLKPLLKPNTLNPTRVLNDFKVETISKLNWYNNLPISVSIEQNISEVKPIKNLHGLVNITENDLYRFSGYYMPIFYDIELFKKAEDFEEIGNWRFDTSLTDFGILKERKIKKVNRKESILKLKNDRESRSIYPMLDEFGLTTYDFFIFKSTWDFEYYIESNFVSLNIINKPSKENATIVDSKNFGKPVINQNKNKEI